MKISIEIGKLKKCRGCLKEFCTIPLEFKFNFSTLKVDCYWKHESFYNNDNKSYERLYKNDHIHRDDGPAYIRYYENGKKAYKYWHKNGKFIKRKEY